MTGTCKVVDNKLTCECNPGWGQSTCAVRTCDFINKCGAHGF